MINSRIKNAIVNTKVTSRTVNTKLRTNQVNSTVRGVMVNTRVISAQTGRSTSSSSVTIPIGTPMGLLLSLTYATAIPVTTGTLGALIKVHKPNVRISI